MYCLIDEDRAAFLRPCAAPFVGLVVVVGPETFHVHVSVEHTPENAASDKFPDILVDLIETVLENTAENKLRMLFAGIDHGGKFFPV
ncbi:hypothetical protein SDC9_201364 [bioreactor metagenome]|uniref:Uncharacterized protein n=1 Tax=bioreactor metagenome TaxID=1076179 RepID=A0A645IQQ2_9ZZZZ